MTNRLFALAAATLGALVLGLASTAGVGGLAGVGVARAQSPAPPADAGVPPASGGDDTAVGELDPTDLAGPVDATNTEAATPADTTSADTTPADATPADTTPADATPAAAPDPDAGLDDTPTGSLDQTDLGAPVDDQAGAGTGGASDTGTGTDTTTAPAPAPASDPDAGLDDTPAGCLDQGGLGGPIDDTGAAGATSTDSGTGACAASGTDPGSGSSTDPDAGLDDTPVGGLDDTNLGGPIDDTNQPAADPPPSTTPNPSPAPGGAAPAPGSGSPGAAAPPIYVVINMPSSAPSGSGGTSAPKRKSATKHKSAKKKHKSAKKKHKSSRKRHSTRSRKHARGRRHAPKRDTSGRVGLDLLPKPTVSARTLAARDTARRPSRVFARRGSVTGLR